MNIIKNNQFKNVYFNDYDYDYEYDYDYDNLLYFRWTIKVNFSKLINILIAK